ncbi:MAG: GntR family transcriptional regulator [Firmicutes bacterium]|nr:GntR family transcriptional regulator [Bacillota bacterium]
MARSGGGDGANPFAGAIQPPKSTRTQIYEAIKWAIIDGKLPIGGRLVEAQLVSWLGVSRTPVRESFGQLEQEGWITRLPTGGYIVSPIDVGQARYVYRVRAALEGLLARDACARMTPENREELMRRTEELDRSAQVRDGRSIAATGRNVHSFIADLSDDTIAKRLLSQINDRVELFRSLTVNLQRRQDEVREEHRRIAQALLAEDPDAAQKAMEEHILRAGRALVAVLTEEAQRRAEGE